MTETVSNVTTQSNTVSKTLSDAVNSLLNQISTKSAEPKFNKEMDSLRRMAEAVRNGILNETMVRNVGLSAEAPSAASLLGNADASSASPAVPAAASQAKGSANPVATPYARQKQAYLENA